MGLCPGFVRKAGSSIRGLILRWPIGWHSFHRDFARARWLFDWESAGGCLFVSLPLPLCISLSRTFRKGFIPTLQTYPKSFGLFFSSGSDSESGLFFMQREWLVSSWPSGKYASLKFEHKFPVPHSKWPVQSNSTNCESHFCPLPPRECNSWSATIYKAFALLRLSRRSFDTCS